MKVDRRSFLQFSGFTLAGALAGKGARKWILPHEKPYYAADGVEEWSTSVCRQCPAGCGTRVRKMDGWPVSIEGNPDCPISRGKLCPRGLSALQAQYSPSRVVGPLHRTNRNDVASWQKTTWEEAYRAISLQLKQIREKGHAHHVVGCMENTGGVQAESAVRFFQAYGSSNIVQYGSLRDPGSAAASFVTMGQRSEPVYDLQNANLVLSVGTPLLEGWLSPTWVHRWFGEFRQGRQQRGRFVQAEDRLSPTGAKADEWIPIRSGSEADFLLGLAGVLILEELYDRDFVQLHCAGFEDWIDESGNAKQGFKNSILAYYPLDRLSEFTGVSSVTYLRLARDLAFHGPSVVLAEQMDFTIGMRSLWAAQCLNALLGNIGKQGGVLTPRPDLKFSLGDIPFDSLAKESLSESRLDGTHSQEESLLPLSVATFTDSILSGSPYPVEALFYFPGPALPYFAGREKIKTALSMIPLIVSFSPYLDEKSMDADWILPDCCPLEKWQHVVPKSPEGTPTHATVTRAMEPILDVKDSLESLNHLARGIGESITAAIPWANSEELIKTAATQIYEARRGLVFDSEFSSDWISQMETGGWWASRYNDLPSFRDGLIRKGGWLDPSVRYEDWNRIFALPSGKFEFLSAELQKRLPNSQYLWTPAKPRGASEQFLEAGTVPVFSLDHVSFLQQPFLLETTDQFQRKQWECWAEINPETARLWNLNNDDLVQIQGPAGSITMTIILYPGAMPGYINIAAGVGVYPHADWLTACGKDIFTCLSVERDPLLQIPAKLRNTVQMQKL